jgi:hypothetical protein
MCCWNSGCRLIPMQRACHNYQRSIPCLSSVIQLKSSCFLVPFTGRSETFLNMPITIPIFGIIYKNPRKQDEIHFRGFLMFPVAISAMAGSLTAHFFQRTDESLQHTFCTNEIFHMECVIFRRSRVHASITDHAG